MATPKAPLSVFQQFRKENPQFKDLDDRAVLGIVAQKKNQPFQELEQKYLPKDPIANFRIQNPRFKDATDDEVIGIAAKVKGKTPEEIRQKIAPKPEPKVEAGNMTFGDFVKSTGIGVGSALSGLGYLAEKAGAEKVGKQFRETGRRYEKGFESRMTDAGKLALQKEIFEDDPKSLIGARLSDDAGAALLMTVGKSLPATFSAIIPGALTTQAIQGLAKLGLIGGSSATIPLLAGTASGVTKGAKAIAALPSAVGFGAAEGLSAGAMNAASLEDSIKSMPFAELDKSPVFKALKVKVGEEQARELIAKQAASDVFASTGTAVGAIGAITGGGVLGSIARKVAGQAPAQGVIKTVAKGAASEMAQEAPQSGSEKFLTNVTEQTYLDPTIDPKRGVVAASLSGAAAGAATGGVLNLPTARVGAKRPIPQATPEQATESQQTPQQAADGVTKQATEQAAALAKQASGINVQKTSANVGNIAAATTTDGAIAAAKAVVDNKPVTPKDIFDTQRGRDELLQAIEKKTVSIPGATTGGLNYGQATETKQTEKTGQTDTLQVLEAKARKQLQLVEQNLTKENLARQGGDNSDRNQQAIEFLTRRKELLERQIDQQAYIPKNKIDELDNLITGQETRKITNPDTWSNADQRVLDMAYSKRQELVELEQLDTFNTSAPLAASAEVSPDQNVSVEPQQEQTAPVAPEPPTAQPETEQQSRIESPTDGFAPSMRQLYDRLSAPTTSREQFAQDVIQLARDKETGAMPRFNTGEDLFEYLNTRNMVEGTAHPIDGNAILRRFDPTLIREIEQQRIRQTEALNTEGSVYNNPELRVRSDASPEVLAEGQKAYTERIQRNADRVNATALAIRLSTDFKEGNGAELVGQQIKDLRDIAQLAQILRDPRFETLRIFIIGEGKILGHYALSSRLPSMVSFNMRNVTDAINQYMTNTPNATGFVLLHNHPSGDPTPSKPDINMTKEMAEKMPKLMGHIVIDTGSYSTINREGKVNKHEVTNNDFGKVGKEHWAVNLRIFSHKDLASLAKSFQNKEGFFTLVGLDARLRVAGISEVPNTAMKLDKIKLAAVLRRFARETGSTKMVAVLPEGSPIQHDKKFLMAVKTGLVNEVLDIRNGQELAIFSELSVKTRKPAMADAPRKEVKSAKFVSIDKSIRGINDKVAELKQTQQQMAAQIKATNALKKQVKADADATVSKSLKTGLKQAVVDSKIPSRDLNQEQRINQVSGPTPDNNANPAPPEITKEEAFRQKWQDNMLRVKNIQKWVEDQTGKPLSEHADVYTRENLSKATTANKIEDFRKGYVSELVQDAGKAGVDVSELAEYLEMRHVPEANAYQRFIHNDPNALANGISDQVANDILAKYQKRKDFAKFEQLAERMWEIGNMTLDLRVQAGLISKEQVSAYRARYQYWVPLRGEDLKRSVKDKRRFGHAARDEFVFENLVLGHEIAIMQAEQNKLAMSIATFLIEADNPNIGTIGAPRKFMTLDNMAYVVSVNGTDITAFKDKDQAKKFIDDVTSSNPLFSNSFSINETSDPQVILRVKPLLQPNEVALYINGQEIRLQINDEAAAKALKRVGLEALGGFMGAAREVNNYLSKSYTAWSPDFIFTNMARDIGGGSFVLTGEYGVGVAAKILGNYGKAISRLITHAKGNRDKVVEQYREFGGNTGAAYLEDIDRVGRTSVMAAMELMNTQTAYNTAYKQLEAEASRKGIIADPKVLATKAALKTGLTRLNRIPVLGHFLKVMEAVNGVAENALRVSTFEVLVKEGKSPQEAAAMAKNLMNFNRKGTIANQAGALYLFFNPGMQGTHIFARAFARSKHRKQVWALASAMTITSLLLAEFMRGGGDDDERAWGGIPEYVKERNLVFGTKDAQVTIPVSYGFGVFHAIGNLLSDWMHGEKTSDTSWKIGSALFTHFFVFGNPLVETQGEKEIRLDMLLPTLAKMGGAPYTNMDGLGRPLYPMTFDETLPDSQRMTRSARNTWYEGMATNLNEITGGDKYTKGALDVSPNTLKFWVESTTGGWGKFAADASQMVGNVPRGVNPELENIPIIRKFARTPGIGDARGGFWKEAVDVKREYKRLKKMEKDNSPALNFIPDSKREDIKTIYKLMDSQSKLAAKIRNRMIEIQADKNLSLKEKHLQVKELERQEAHAYDVFLDEFELRKKRE